MVYDNRIQHHPGPFNEIDNIPGPKGRFVRFIALRSLSLLIYRRTASFLVNTYSGRVCLRAFLLHNRSQQVCDTEI